MWLEILAIVVIGFLILKFVFKPLFKVIALVALVVVAWWLINGGGF